VTLFPGGQLSSASRGAFLLPRAAAVGDYAQPKKCGARVLGTANSVVLLILLFTGWKGWEMVYRHRISVSDSLGRRTRRERVRRYAYRCVGVAVRNRQNQLRPSSLLRPVGTRHVHQITSACGKRFQTSKRAIDADDKVERLNTAKAKGPTFPERDGRCGEDPDPLGWRRSQAKRSSRHARPRRPRL
jgi:hypothetical protein